MFECPNCDYQTEKLNSLRIHAAKVHQIISEDLYLQVVIKGPKPVCACGCEEFTKYNGLIRGYTKYRPGHQARVKNNWGHNEKAKQKSQDTRRKMFQDGDLDVWNKGLTKEDPRVAAYAQAMSESFTDEKRKEYGDRMRRNRLSGVVPSLHGPDHPNWKGGVSSLSTLCHSNQRLYKEWKYPKLVAAGFKCERCNSTDSLHVHHSETRMADLVNEVRRSQPDVLCDHESLTPMVNQVIDLHTIRDVPGLVLCSACHCLEHPPLNF